MCMETCMPQWIGGASKTAFKYQVSPSTVCLTRMEFRSSGLARSPFSKEPLSKWIL